MTELHPLLEAFRTEVCLRGEEIDPNEEEDWHSLSIGFFIAKGASPKEARKLALEARYRHEYWCGELELQQTLSRRWVDSTPEQRAQLILELARGHSHSPDILQRLFHPTLQDEVSSVIASLTSSGRLQPGPGSDG